MLEAVKHVARKCTPALPNINELQQSSLMRRNIREYGITDKYGGRKDFLVFMWTDQGGHSSASTYTDDKLIHRPKHDL